MKLILALVLALPFAANVDDEEWIPNHKKAPEIAEDVADVPALDLQIGGDEHKRAFLIGLEEKAKAPRGGYGLVVVLPGGDGGPNFTSFVRRIHQNAIPKDFLTLQLVAPEWKEGQHKNLVWPTERSSYPPAKFSTEQFVKDAIEDVKKRTKIDKKRILSLSWSSGGPPTYALTLEKKTPLTGSLILMSVFRPESLPSLKRAKGYPYYLMQSPEDETTAFSFAEAAKEALEKAKARVELESYEGGHSWPMPIYPRLKKAFEWLLDD